MGQKYCYDFPRPAVTVDIVLFRRTPELQVLLIGRKNDPFAGAWAFPGGFIDEEEPLDAAAERELREETGISGVALHQFGAFGDPGRDPRGHTVTIAFTGEVEGDVEMSSGDDATNARWFSVDKLPRLAFDHAKILEVATNKSQIGNRKS